MATATVKSIIERAYTKVNGEYEALDASSDDFNTYLVVLNEAMEEWATTPYVKWQSLYNPNFTVGVVAPGVLQYSVSDDVILADTPYDSVYFVDGSGVVVATYKVLNQAQYDASQGEGICALLGSTLYFKSLPSKLVGTSIKLPVYTLPQKYTSATQTVKIDSIQWLIKYMAATICDASPVPFIARNAEKYYKQAEISMKTMKDNNRHKQQLVIKSLGRTGRYRWADVLPQLTIKDL